MPAFSVGIEVSSHSSIACCEERIAYRITVVYINHKHRNFANRHAVVHPSEALARGYGNNGETGRGYGLRLVGVNETVPVTGDLGFA